MNPEDVEKFENATQCHICQRPFENGNTVRVRDHCHITGKFRGAAHELCDLKYRKQFFIPVVFHNLARYDAHSIIDSIANTMKEMNKGFLKASSENLPRVHIDMLGEFFLRCDCFQGPKLQHIKTAKSMRPVYAEVAIGYVQLRREGDICTVEAKICPEHRPKSKNYTVRVIVDEKAGQVTRAECSDCAALKGGCKHAVAFVGWLYRKSEDPSPTSTECYWKKPFLSSVGTTIKYQTIKEMCGVNDSNTDQDTDNCNFLLAVMSHAKAKTSRGHLFQFYNQNPMKATTLHSLAVTFESDRKNVSEFLTFCAQALTPGNCEYILKMTSGQSNSVSWYQQRYARITASVIYEAAQCKTFDGSLVERILSMKILDTEAMRRGRELENEVLSVVEQRIRGEYGESKVRKNGLRLSSEYPVIGASTDGETETAVLEVKCPSSQTSVSRYIDRQRIQKKFRAQLHVQMLLADKHTGYFCVADPSFESNQEVTIIREDFDKKFTDAVIKRAMSFWEKTIFPHLMKPFTSDAS